MRKDAIGNYMPKKECMFVLFIVMVFFIIVIVMLVLSKDAAASTRRSPLALLLAQTCVAEISFSNSPDECVLMWQVNQTNALKRGRSLERQTKLFNSYWKSKSQRANRPWIAYLNHEATKPKHWPNHLSWQAHSQRWQRYLTAANRYVVRRSNYTPMCINAVDYGAVNEYPKSRSLVPMKCLSGNTKQRYWKVK